MVAAMRFLRPPAVGEMDAFLNNVNPVQTGKSDPVLFLCILIILSIFDKCYFGTCELYHDPINSAVQSFTAVAIDAQGVKHG